MRIERKQNNFIQLPSRAQGRDRFFREGFPVTHRRNGHNIDLRLERRNQCFPLPLRQNLNRRTPPNHRVSLSDGHGTLLCNVVRQRFAQKTERPHRNDVWIQKQIAQKRFDTLKRVRSAQLKQHHADSFSAGQRISLSASSQFFTYFGVRNPATALSGGPGLLSSLKLASPRSAKRKRKF